MLFSVCRASAMAVGVARPIAQGQAINRTLTAATNAKLSAGSGPTMSQVAKAINATTMTMGTNTPAMRSAGC